MSNKLKIWLISFFASLVFKIFIFSWRSRVIAHPQLEKDLKEGRPVIFAHWHSDIQGMMAFSRHYPVVAIASVSKDGEIISQVLERLGSKVARGSSSKKGAQGLRSLIRFARKGFVPVIPVDGPRGPRFIPKPGVFELSKILGARIYPGSIAASSKYTLKKAWDQAYLPKLFSSVVLVWGEPIEPISDAQDPRDTLLANQLKEKIFQTSHLASQALKELI